MHFSRPSAYLLSWCRPWKRGAVGFFSSGYCSVTTFLNIVEKVTPNPLTGSSSPRASSPGPSLCGVSATVILLVDEQLVRMPARGNGGRLLAGRLAPRGLAG